MNRLWIPNQNQANNPQQKIVPIEITDEDITSPQVSMALFDYLDDNSFASWHNLDWMIYRQPRYQIGSDPRFFVLHRPSCTGLLDFAPLAFVSELIGPATLGIGHTSESCKECLPPNIDEHPTLAGWYRRLSAMEVR